MGSTLDDFKEDPFKSKDVFGGDSSGGGSDPFQNDDPFKEGGFIEMQMKFRNVFVSVMKWLI